MSKKLRTVFSAPLWAHWKLTMIKIAPNSRSQCTMLASQLNYDVLPWSVYFNCTLMQKQRLILTIFTFMCYSTTCMIIIFLFRFCVGLLWSHNRFSYLVYSDTKLPVLYMLASKVFKAAKKLHSVAIYLITGSRCNAQPTSNWFLLWVNGVWLYKDFRLQAMSG